MAMSGDKWLTAVEDFHYEHPKLRPLIAMIRHHGYVCYFNNKPLSLGWGFAAFSQEAKAVWVNLRQPDGKFWPLADIAYLLRHELRHIEHAAYGLFAPYYDKRDEFENRPDQFIVALAAERNCDLWAKNYIDAAFPNANSILRNRAYPSWRVIPTFLPDGPRYERWLIDAYYKGKKQCESFYSL